MPLPPKNESLDQHLHNVNKVKYDSPLSAQVEVKVPKPDVKVYNASLVPPKRETVCKGRRHRRFSHASLSGGDHYNTTGSLGCRRAESPRGS